jgi:uncharacterized membrane protein YjgN (DUF898 family)
VDSPAIIASTDSFAVDFAGRRWPLFWLALKSSVLTIITLGLYRFWMKTRLRRWYWSAIRPGGQPLEYTGNATEKLLGFLMAVVVLAFYIGVVNLILMFLSLMLFADNYAAYLASFAGVVPLWFFASYRARQYVLARTRWRGLRFALEPGAWGYAGRALLHGAFAVLTLGILWPRMTFILEKYQTDRTFYGSTRLHQGGRWQMLFRPFLHILIPGFIRPVEYTGNIVAMAFDRVGPLSGSDNGLAGQSQICRRTDSDSRTPHRAGAVDQQPWLCPGLGSCDVAVRTLHRHRDQSADRKWGPAT